jgi:hypothetical protein
MTPWIEKFGRQRKGLEAVHVDALKRIQFPPQAYIEMKCAIQGTHGEARNTAIERFCKRMPDFVGEIKTYQEELLEIRLHNYANAEYALAANKINYAGNALFDNAVDPIDRVTRNNVLEWMLVVDFDFKREHGRLKMAKIYIPLTPEVFLEKQP